MTEQVLDGGAGTPTRIGRYEIVRRLGKSMTDVYLAMDTVENRKVALKLIPQGDDGASRMIVEAERRGAAIQKDLHTSDPRMVEIYEYGDLDGYRSEADPAGRRWRQPNDRGGGAARGGDSEGPAHQRPADGGDLRIRRSRRL